MVNWQVTATTFYCSAVDDEVTVMVYKDRSVKCTGPAVYRPPSREVAALLKKKSARLQRKLECPGPDCPQASAYRERLFAEETAKGGGK